jgi:hypothetical protein
MACCKRGVVVLLATGSYGSSLNNVCHRDGIFSEDSIRRSSAFRILILELLPVFVLFPYLRGQRIEKQVEQGVDLFTFHFPHV